MAKTPMTTEAAWSIYADALSTLASLFWWAVLPLLLGAFAGGLMSVSGEADTGSIVFLVAALVSGFSFPIVLGVRAGKIQRWVRQREAA